MIGKKVWVLFFGHLQLNREIQRNMSGYDYKTDVHFFWFEEICTKYNCIEDLSLLFNSAVICQHSVA
jgi:hypothetical protein